MPASNPVVYLPRCLTLMWWKVPIIPRLNNAQWLSIPLVLAIPRDILAGAVDNGPVRPVKPSVLPTLIRIDHRVVLSVLPDKVLYGLLFGVWDHPRCYLVGRSVLDSGYRGLACRTPSLATFLRCVLVFSRPPTYVSSASTGPENRLPLVSHRLAYSVVEMPSRLLGDFQIPDVASS